MGNYGPDALRALVAHARASGRVRRIVADTAPDDRASQRVLDKAGPRPVGSDVQVHRYALDLTSGGGPGP